MDEEFGRYRLRGLLGAGGMGQVHRAYDTELHREVAIKLLPPQASSDPSFEQRFRREARTAAGLDEPHVVPIFDSGQINGRLFIAMRLIDGTDVATLLRDNGPMPPEQAVTVIEQAAAALDAAHGAGLVHRDVKPANLLVTPKNFVYLIDFGIARAAGETKLTGTGAAIGTVAYMAPERFTTGHADHRADIYALACVLHECLTGTTPYPVTSLEQQMFAHVNGPPPRLSQIRPDIPAGFDDVIARGMTRDPDRRYQSAGELAEAARDALAAAPSTSAPVATPAAITDPAPLSVRAAGDSPSHPAATPPRPDPRAAAPQRHYQTPAGPTGLAATRPAALPPPMPATKPKRRLRLRWIALLAAAAVLIAAVTAGIVYSVNKPSAPISASAARTVTATIEVGNAPADVAVDPDTHTAYVTNSNDNTMSVIDTSANTVTATIRVGNYPRSVAVDPDTHTAYNTNQSDGTVSVIDTSTNTVTTTIKVGNYPRSVAVDPDTHIAYTTDYGADTVSVIDTTTRTVTDTINVKAGPVGVAVGSATHTAYITDYGAGAVSLIDTTTHTVTDTIEVGDAPAAVALDESRHTAYVANFGSNTVSVIDTNSAVVTSTIINTGPRLAGMAVDPATHTAYITDHDNNTVSLIDTTTNTFTTTINVGLSPAGVAVDPTTHTAYVANNGDGTVSVIKPSG